MRNIILEKKSIYFLNSDFMCVDRYSISDKRATQYIKIYQKDGNAKDRDFMKVDYKPFFSIIDKINFIESLKERGFTTAF